MTSRILYVTFDGVLEPLGYSQVARLVMALARRGLRYEILSLEKPKDLRREDDVRRVRSALGSAGVSWRFAPYADGGGVKNLVANVQRMTALTMRASTPTRPRLIHARSYHAGLVALATKAALGVPFLFDARSYWIDEKLDEGRWFSNATALRVARALERRFYTEACGVVTLTELSRDDVAVRGRFGAVRAPVLAIPTCADYDEFPLRPSPAPLNKPVVGLVGSTNASYDTVEMLACARSVLERIPEARLLVVTAQTDAFATLIARAGIDASRVSITSARHDEMLGHLHAMDFAIQFLVTTTAKRASMPTKLAEFFAAGVRPIHHGGNGEIAEWVRRAGSGVVVDALSQERYAAVAEWIASQPHGHEVVGRAREITRPHFSLTAGADRYEALLRQLLATSA